MPEAKRRHFLREKESERILKEFSQKFKLNITQILGGKVQIETAETQAGKIFYVNNRPLLANLGNTFSPTLLFEEGLNQLPRIVVNMGAVPHICNGADVMAPGVVRIENEYKMGDFLVVADERHNKPLAVTVALTDSQAARNMKHGKIARNIHYVGDDLWNELKRIGTA